ncbi:MAG: DegT/DnrJ/EryC1/StrS family aminotransferase, partial [Proteobacteria bacterium]|nr:DegT/DnrJ/EryC1/StrS family aminotransferase [Pseudomonadota bacterium]
MLIPYTKHQIAREDVTSVLDALVSGALVDGDLVRKFETKISELTNSGHSVAVNSGTSGLHIAYLAMGIGSQSLVWTVPNTFVATANAARLCGAEVDFVDIDPSTYAISTAALEEKLFTARVNGRPLPDLVVPVHFAGAPVDMVRIGELAKEYGFSVVEDAAHALGARANGDPVGDCSFSAITVFSTHPAKIITTGEGGVCTTNSEELASRMRLLRSHGIDKAASNPREPFLYEQHLLGLNYRLSEFSAALGLSQLRRLPALARLRREIVARYQHAMA